MLLDANADAGLLLKAVPPNAGGTHEEIIRNLFQPDQDQVQRYALSGLAATHFIGVRTDEQGRTQNIETAIVTGPKNLHYALAYASKSPQALTNARSGLCAAEGSFRALTAADRKAVQPWTLHVVKAPAGGLRDLAQSTPLSDYPEQQLRLLNGFYGGGEAKAGSLVKTV